MNRRASTDLRPPLFCLLLLAGSHAFQPPNVYLTRMVSNEASCSRLILKQSATPLEYQQSSLSNPAQWHRERRRQMLNLYGDQISPLEREASSQNLGIPLLLVTNLSLLFLSILSGSLPIPAVLLLAIFPGSIFSLWQLQMLHDVLHGSFFEKGSSQLWGYKRKDLQDKALFWGSMPSIFGYFLYLKYGHLTHHKNVGDPSSNLAQLFDSNKSEFEDGDMLFVAHRMHLNGDYGPKLPIPFRENKHCPYWERIYFFQTNRNPFRTSARPMHAVRLYFGPGYY
jgi:hypothetical protein